MLCFLLIQHIVVAQQNFYTSFLSSNKNFITFSVMWINIMFLMFKLKKDYQWSFLIMKWLNLQNHYRKQNIHRFFILEDLWINSYFYQTNLFSEESRNFDNQMFNIVWLWMLKNWSNFLQTYFFIHPKEFDPLHFFLLFIKIISVFRSYKMGTLYFMFESIFKISFF